MENIVPEYAAEAYDIAVIGGGHAGCEAAVAAARLGKKTILFTLSLDAIANLPCNPSIGGTAKGHLVREIDALGGEMGKITDEIFLQSRMLNMGKGPAVHSLRVQADRQRYHIKWKHLLEKTPNLHVKQAEVVGVKVNDDRRITHVITHLGACHPVGAAILATGTYLKGVIFVGDAAYSSGPDGVMAANQLSQSLEAAGIALRRFKTGTPARLLRSSIDFSKMEVQVGDEPIVPMSFETDPSTLKNQAVCHITYTNEQTHQIVRDNLHRSPLYGGKIHGVGPRYCPSLEDKVVRFGDKSRHQVFVEPVGAETEEVYLQGMSTSLPEDVQVAMYHSVAGLENCTIMRNAYAIEYDCVDPLDLQSSLEFKSIKMLYGAGQFNGTSGYEEAAAQGVIAGVNASRALDGQTPIIMRRDQSYIGTLIDDLVTKGCSDPYRMMTSRSEYRLLLRQDNADARLTELGHEIGLISEDRYQRFLQKQEQIRQEGERVAKVTIPPSQELNALLLAKDTSTISTGIKLVELIRRPQLSYQELALFDPNRPTLPDAVTEQVEILIKYEGYLKKQQAQVEQMRRLDAMPLPENIDYTTIRGLRIEAQEKLNRVHPVSLGQASRVSGVNPADVSVLVIWLETQGRHN